MSSRAHPRLRDAGFARSRSARRLRLFPPRLPPPAALDVRVRGSHRDLPRAPRTHVIHLVIMGRVGTKAEANMLARNSVFSVSRHYLTKCVFLTLVRHLMNARQKLYDWQNAGISTDLTNLHYAMSGYNLQQPRAAGGFGPNQRILLLANRNIYVAREYGCLMEDKEIAFRASYLIDPKGVLRL